MMRCKKMQSLAIPAVDIAKFCIADADGILQHGRKDRLKIAGRATDDLEHLRRGCLLLKRFREVGGALGEVGGPLTQFVEQPRVLDSDNCLSSEVLSQCNLSVGEGSNFLAVHTKCTDEFVLLQHWDSKVCPYTPKFDGCNVRRVFFNIGRLCWASAT